MAKKWNGPRNDDSARDGVISPTIKKRYPRNAQSNRDMRAAARYTSVDSRFSTVDSAGWGSE
jgi:hypothetical protein